MVARTTENNSDSITSLPAPTPWPGANARLLGLGMGLPISPLKRLAQFSAADFERFTLEWATGYLANQIDVFEVQSRGGAKDKGRDIIVWLDATDTVPRRWQLYQCKHYDANLGLPKAGIEIAKVLHYTFIGDYSTPEAYFFVTHKGVTSPLQDLLDNPEALRHKILTSWSDYAGSIGKEAIELVPELRKHIELFPFSIFRAKQPHDLLEEHAKTKFHLTVFGAPLIQRASPPLPPSTVAANEVRYVEQLYQAIGVDLGFAINNIADFKHSKRHARIFERSRLTFYSAEGLRELARDQMSDHQYFDSLLREFSDGLFYCYTAPGCTPLERLGSTVQGAQSLQLGAHPLAPHMTTNDREGMCHHMANEDHLNWCNP